MLFKATTGEPIALWLSGLHIPETYLAALIQMTCRLNQWPLDYSRMYTKVTQYVDASEIEENPEQVKTVFATRNCISRWGNGITFFHF